MELNLDEPEITNYKHQIKDAFREFQISKQNQTPIVWNFKFQSL